MTRRSAGILLGMALLLSLAACSPRTGPANEEAKIRTVIERYNELLSQGYRSLNMNHMREAATKLQSEDEYIHMSALAEGGIRLDPLLKELVFTKLSVEATSAVAETRETWDYRQYQRDTGALLLEQKGLVYDLAYDLEKQADGRWLVSDIRAISATTTVEPTIIATPTVILPGH